MIAKDLAADFPILRTKLYRPRVAADMVVRDPLLAKLEAGRQLPLTLVSAPAGYGKSTLVSHWLDTTELPSAWLSPEETESDPRVFLEYLVAAVRGLLPGSCEAVRALLRHGELPPPAVVAGQLTNDLDAIDTRFVLAVDDYHAITDLAVHEIVDFVVSQAPRSLHLVILSRRDPLLSLVRYRARHQMTEVRMPELRFTAAEAAAFLTRALGESLDEAAAVRLHEATEGWPMALRLAVGAIERRAKLEGLLKAHERDALETHEFLVSEFLLQQPTALTDWLCKTAILNRFCAGLAEAVCAPGRGPADGELTGEAFLERLEHTGLPMVALDGDRDWHRYHHLVGKLLMRHLERDFDAAEIAVLHRRAAEWYERENLMEDALCHFAATGEPREASALVLRHRDALLAHEQWHRLDRWISWLPHASVDADPELVLLKAWSCEHRGRYWDFVHLVEQAEGLLAEVEDEERRHRLAAEIEAMQAGIAYQNKEAAVALAKSRRALERIPRESEWVWVYTTKAQTLSLLMAGDGRGAFAVIDDALEAGRSVNEMVRGHLLATRCFLHWIVADRAGLERTGRAILAYPWSRELPETAAWATYFLGAALYHSNGLEEAESLLQPVARDPASPNIANQLRSVYALASIHHARGQDEDAHQLLDTATERLHQAGNTTFLPEVEAFRAELGLRQGHLAEALRWAEGFEPSFASSAYSFFLPELTVVRAWLADDSPHAVARATESAERQVRLLESIHGTRFLIEALVLRALCHETAGKRDTAHADLARGLEIAQPGGYIRLFVDLGPQIIPLLHTLELDAEKMRYVGEILSAFPQPPGSQPLIEPLTPRELEILDLVSERLSNREIGARLHIAAGTVKRHTHSIYGKLAVHDRWLAVDKARGLGILRGQRTSAPS